MSDDSKELSRMEDILSGEDYLPKKPMSRIEELLLDGAMVPKVDSTDNGKVLKVIDGEWKPGEDVSGDNLPPVSSLDNGKVLKVVSGEWNIGSDKSDIVMVQMGVSYESFKDSSQVTLPTNIKSVLLANYYSNPPVPTYLITTDSVIFQPIEVNKSAGTTQLVQIRWGRFHSELDSVTHESNVYNDSIIYNTQDNDTIARFTKSAALQTIPPVDSTDEGKVMQVGNDGTWQANDLPTYDDVPQVEAADVGKVLKATAVGEYDWGDAPDPLPAVTSTDNGKVLKVIEGAWTAGADEAGSDNICVPPVIFDNGNLKKMTVDDFPGITKVYLTAQEYAALSTAEKQDLSKIYYISQYKYFENSDHTLTVRVDGVSDVWIFFNGWTFDDSVENNLPVGAAEYCTSIGNSYGYSDAASTTRPSTAQPCWVRFNGTRASAEFASDYQVSNNIFWPNVAGKYTSPVYGKLKIGEQSASYTYSDPFDTGETIVIYYGGKQYTDFDIPDPLPTVDSEDNGKVLKVVSGAWAADTIPTGLEVVKLSQTAYDSLSDAQKKNGKMYLIDASIFTGGIPRVSGADSKITASSPSGNYYQPWLAFDGNDHTPGSDNDGWAPSNGDDQWIKYQFATATPINKIQFKAVSRNTSSWSGTIYIEGSNDDTTWENILKNKLSITTELPARSSSSVEFNEDANGKSYTYIRLRINNQSYQKFMLAEFDADITTLTYDSIYYMDRQYSTMYEPVPEVTMADAGKALIVNSEGEWDKSDIPSTCTPVEIEAADYHALTTPQKEDTTKVYFVKAGRVITDPVSVIPRNPSGSNIAYNTGTANYNTSATLAFDGVMNTPPDARTAYAYDVTAWCPGYGNVPESAWVSYHFDAVTTNLVKLEAYAYNMSTSTPSATFTTPVIVEGSTDGTTWFNILADGASSFTLNSKETEFVKNEIPLDNTKSVSYIRFRFLNQINGYNETCFAIAEIYAYTGNVVVYDDSTYYKGIKHGKTLQELPDLVVADEGKVLKAVNGNWSKSDIYVECTQAEYDLLPSSKNSDGIIYFITDNS